MKLTQEINHSASDLKSIFETYLFEKAFEEFPYVLLQPAMQIMRMKAKRLRPILLLTACEAFGGNPETALDAASAVEIYHNFTLVHDDIIDKADIRRNESTVHKKYGINKAILAGDAMLIHAQQLINTAAASINNFDLVKTFQKTAMDVIKGEQMDVDFEDLPEVSVEDYLEMSRLKTSVLLAGSLKLGAMIGEASNADLEKIYDFGMNLGLAFQIKDDYLDSFGDQKTFGKKIGGDILQNKKTYLLCVALKKANENTKKEIFNIIEEKDSEKKINEMLAVYEKCDIKEETVKQMETFFNKSMKSLQEVSLVEKKKEHLLQLAESIYQRSF
ncbi:MAG: polyprenyl synthetase family protein [Bacteroidales bacterium]|nr:polyprenyl synthetase family protein [Bacteroidales bacterium]